MTAPVRLPDAASPETVLAGLYPASADANLVPALAAAFPALRSALRRGSCASSRIGSNPAPALTASSPMTPVASVQLLIDRIEAVDREVRLPFGWFFLVTHGHWVDPHIGLAIAQGLKARRVRPRDREAGLLLRWADRASGF